MSQLLPIHRASLTAWFNVNNLEQSMGIQPTQLHDYPQLHQPDQSIRAYNQMMHHPSREYTPAQQQLILAGEAIAHGYQTNLVTIIQDLLDQLIYTDAPQLCWEPTHNFDLLSVDLPTNLNPHSLSIDALDHLIRESFNRSDNNHHGLYVCWTALGWDCRPILLMIVNQLLQFGKINLILPTNNADQTLLTKYRHAKQHIQQVKAQYRHNGIDLDKLIAQHQTNVGIDPRDPNWKIKLFGAQEGDDFG